MWERWAFLDEMAAEETEVAMLGIDGRFFVERAVLEVEHQPCGDPLAMRDLDEITIGESFSRRRAQHKKTMDQALRVANGDRIREHWHRLEQGSAGYKNRERAPTTF
jgi:hypothetical protein